MENERQKHMLRGPVSGALPADKLFAVLAHEIANPLDNVSAGVRLLDQSLHETYGPMGEPIDKLLRLVTDEINHLTVLLINFRAHDFFGSELRPASLAHLIEDCLALESVKAALLGIHIQCDVSSGLPLIMADGPKLKQVLLNLCENALEAMPAGGTISVRAYRSPTDVCLDVQDRGPGIPEGVDVFAPFVSTKGRGSGLGLFVAQRIVEVHSGTISYTSRRGEGTTFHLAFPIHPKVGFKKQWA